MSDDVCPKIIIRASDQESKEKASTAPLFPSNNTINLKNIICNSHEPVLLRLLSCKEEIINTKQCPFSEPTYSVHKNILATKKTCETENDLAQIYFRHEKINLKARSGIIIFIEGNKLHHIDMLISRFINTIEWLNISNENPYLFLIIHGDPIAEVAFVKNQRFLEERIKKKYSGYSEDEDICFLTRTVKNAEVLLLNYTTKFSIRAQKVK